MTQNMNLDTPEKVPKIKKEKTGAEINLWDRNIYSRCDDMRCLAMHSYAWSGGIMHAMHNIAFFFFIVARKDKGATYDCTTGCICTGNTP